MSAIPPPLPQSASEIWSQPGNASPSTTWSQEDVSAYLDRPLLSGNVVFPGTAGMTLRDIEQDILKGGRFIVHHWCVSVLVMTFSNVTAARYVRSWRSGAGQAWLYSALSLMLGWWGFPFGFIYTPLCLWKNGRGGTDVTAELLHQILGPTRTQSVMSQAALRKVDSFHWLLLIVSLGLPLGLVLAFVSLVAKA